MMSKSQVECGFICDENQPNIGTLKNPKYA